MTQARSSATTEPSKREQANAVRAHAQAQVDELVGELGGADAAAQRPIAG